MRPGQPTRRGPHHRETPLRQARRALTPNKGAATCARGQNALASSAVVAQARTAPVNRLLGLHIYTSRPRPEMRAHAADRVSGPPWRWHLRPQVHAAGVRHLTAKPVRRSRAKGQRREPGQDDPDAAGAQDLDPDRRQALALDYRRVPHPGRRPCPRTLRQSRPPRPRPPRRSSKRLPETPVSLPGITLSDEGGQGERAPLPLFATLPTRLRSPRPAPNRLICCVEPVRMAVIDGEGRLG